MHAVYDIFETEVSGMDHPSYAVFYASLMSDLPAEAAANVSSKRSSKRHAHHVGETTLPARAVASEKRALLLKRRRPARCRPSAEDNTREEGSRDIRGRANSSARIKEGRAAQETST